VAGGPIVVKVGGGLLVCPGALNHVCDTLGRMSPGRSMVVVPGGGPFADAVRSVDASHSLTPDDAHWMAILGMDQYAILIASRIRRADLVHRRGEVARAVARGRIPVLAPYRWLREADPLPHSWDVTSDSIAAWVAGEIGARQLILIKPSIDGQRAMVDPCFERTCPPSVARVMVTPEMLTESLFPA